MNEAALKCLDCGAAFDEADVNASSAGAEDRCYVACGACGARNEIRADRMPGLGVPPQAVVVRVLRD